MNANKDLAKGILNNSNGKIKRETLWKNIVNELNALGPPIRDIKGWKKVWQDHRYYVKKKLATNEREFKATGGGPNILENINEMEQITIEAAGLELAACGMNIKKFGAIIKPKPVPMDINAPLPSTSVPISNLISDDTQASDEPIEEWLTTSFNESAGQNYQQNDESINNNILMEPEPSNKVVETRQIPTLKNVSKKKLSKIN